MRRLLLGCGVIRSDIEDMVGDYRDLDVMWLDETLHARPENLTVELQKIIDATRDYDQILLSYSLCGNALLGICATNCDILYPAIDDCICGFLHGDCALPDYRRRSIFTNRGWLDTSFNDMREYTRAVEKYGEERGRQIFKKMYQHYKDLIYMQIEDEVSEYHKQKAKKMADNFELELKFVPANTELYKQLLDGRVGGDVKLLKKGDTLTAQCFHALNF